MSENSRINEEEAPAPGGPAGGYPIDPGRLWAAVQHDWRWIPIAMLVGFVLSAAFAKLRMPVTFEAETVLIYEPPQASRNIRELSTLAGILTLPGTLSEVRNSLKLPVSIKQLENRVEVWFDASSNLVTVVAKGPSGEQAAQLANTLVDVFFTQQSELAKARATESSSQLVTDLASAKEVLGAARAAYDEFRHAHGIIDFTVELDQAMKAVGSIKQEQEQAEADTKSLAARASTLSSLTKSSPRMQVQSATHSDPDAAQLAQLRSQLASLSSRLAPGHPQISRLKAQIASIESASKTSSNVVADVVSTANPELAQLRSNLSSTKMEQAALGERVKSLAVAVKGAEQRLAGLSAIEGEARALLRAVESAEKRTGELQALLSSAREVEHATATEFRVLTRATVPPYPESSMRKVVVIGVTVVAGLIALLVLLFRIIRDGRIHTAREGAFWSKFPVVASSTWPRDERAFHRFVDELNDHASRSTGTTLVVSAANQQAVLATKLADWLGRVQQDLDDDTSVIGEEPRSPDSSGDHPVKRHGAQLVHNTALAHPTEPRRPPVSFHAWRGGLTGTELRRASRLADRVIVLVGSGDESFTRLSGLRTLLGRDSGVALIFTSVPETLMNLPDRVGDADHFWGIS